MKKLQYYFLIGITFVSLSNLNAQNLKPYVMGAASGSTMDQVKAEIKTNLESEGLKVLGGYAPADDPDRWVFAISSEELVQAVKSVGGLAGFALALKIGLTKEAGKIMISYTNPAYWGNAYFRSDYPGVAQQYQTVTTKIEAAVKKTGEWIGEDFGSEAGIEAEDLWKYRYMMGMPRFDDVEDLNEFNSYDDAISKITANLEKGVENVTLVYEVEIPYENIKLYGFGLGGEEGEWTFLPKIDITKPRHTAFLPYEMLVVDGKAFILHGRFRIAVSFPDLKMGTFTKIMSTPGDIEDMLKKVTE